MPDPTFKTISATQASVLFEVNPYTTPWMLFHHFREKKEFKIETHSRMDWGKKLEPLVLDEASKMTGTKIIPNQDPDNPGEQVYFRRGLFGATPDAFAYDPKLGWGAVECKCVFDYRTWMSDWKGGKKVPRNYEIQLQDQMKVGRPEDGPFKWGMFVVWIASEMMIFKREPLPVLWEEMDKLAKEFFKSVAENNEPDPLADPHEFPMLNELYPIQKEKILDLRDDPSAEELSNAARMIEFHKQERLGHQRGEEQIKMRFRALAKDHEKVALPGGIWVTLKQNKTGVGVKVDIPQNIDETEVEYEYVKL